MLRKFLPAPVIFILVIGLTFGLDYGKIAQARTTSTLTTPSDAAKKHIGTEQTIKKSQNTPKENHKATVAKKKTNKKASIAKKKTKDTHIVNKASHKKQNATIAKNKAKKSHIAKKGTHKNQIHVIAKNKNRKKTHLARHTGKHKHHRYVKKSKVNNIDALVAENESTKAEPVDLWLAKDAPEKFRQGTNDEELDRLTLRILESAFSYLGTPYRYGGTSPDGFDCSGFVRHVFSENGISLGRSSRDQALEGRQVSLYDLKPGDLIFFNMRNRRRHIDHVGLYIGKGQFIHASSTQSREIKIEDLDTNRYMPRVVEARRVLEYTR